ncbi:MAG: NADH-quinone oxidoreductase subunit N [Nitrospirae bacterium]|nr:NADH-quinone oxidoreductase subunit N [Nitrospirota bacterium]
MPTLESLPHVLPEVALAVTAAALFVLEALWQPRGRARRVGFPLLALGGLLAALLFLVASPSSAEPRFFGGLLTQDPFSTFVRGVAIVATALAVGLALGSPSLPSNRRVEYHGLLVLLALGMCLLSSAGHLLMIYVAIEIVSLTSYLLAGFDDRGGRSAEAGLKYVLFGGVASGVMLFGFSLLFGLFGDLSLSGLGQALAHSTTLSTGAGRWATLLALVFVLAGLGFKIAAVPFHMWCPDVYEGAPTPFTALLSVGPKAAGFAVLLRFGTGLWPELATDAAAATSALPWLLLLGVMSTVTMTVGNLAAIWQDNLKRLLAYSSIAHAGYMLMGVVAGGREGPGAVAVYLAVYLIMNIGAFAVVSAVDRSAHSEDIGVYHGLGRRAPLLALAMAVFLLSLTGLPPTAGFVGKLYLFASLIHHGGFWYVLLAVVGVLNSVVSLYFYARVLRAMFLESAAGEPAPVSLANSAAALAVVLAVPTLALGIFWQPLAAIANFSGSLF